MASRVTTAPAMPPGGGDLGDDDDGDFDFGQMDQDIRRQLDLDSTPTVY